MTPAPIDSPRACARVVALALMSDGRIGPDERDALRRCGAFARLGLTEQAFWSALLELCDELLSLPAPAAEPDLGGRLLDAVRDPALRMEVLRVVHACVRADGRVHPAESGLLSQALDAWRVPPQALRIDTG